MFADRVGTMPKMVPTQNRGHILAIYGEFSEGVGNEAEKLLPHRVFEHAIDFEFCYNSLCGRIRIEQSLVERTWLDGSWVEWSWVEWSWVVFLQLGGIRSHAHKAGSWIWTGRSHAIWMDQWVGNFLWWAICYRMDYGAVMKSQLKTDSIEVSKDDLQRVYRATAAVTECGPYERNYTQRGNERLKRDGSRPEMECGRRWMSSDGPSSEIYCDWGRETGDWLQEMYHRRQMTINLLSYI